MPRKPQKLLEQMRRSPHNFKRVDLERLYTGYGFQILTDGPHDKISHPQHPQLVTFLPRHKDLAPFYFRDAVKRIDQLIALEAAGDTETEDSDK